MNKDIRGIGWCAPGDAPKGVSPHLAVAYAPVAVYDYRASIARDLKAAADCRRAHVDPRQLIVLARPSYSLARAFEAHAKAEREEWLQRIARGDSKRLRQMQAPPMVSLLGPAERPDPVLAFDAGDGAIRATAARCAALCAEIVETDRDEMSALARCRNLCSALGVEPPEVKESNDPEGCVPVLKAQATGETGVGSACALALSPRLGPALRRLSCSRWWRRRLRITVARRVEARAIAAGKVRKGAAAYCSEAALLRRRAAVLRNHDLMQIVELVNEVGQSFTLSELAELSTSNPELRRNELMTRVKGAEAIALARGDVGLFVTTTLPSRFHAVSDRYDGSTPRQGQAALCIGWARSRALLAKEGIRLYGMRVAEPHLDGTPHAHALIFCAPHQVERVKAVLRERALEESPNEDGAQRHRFTCERINSEMGSAVAYVSKYLAKNVDGFQLEMTLARKKDGGWELVDKNPQTAAERIRTWASTWGIRQFQFFGLPPVTWWRELRRLREGCVSPVIEEARAPADAGDYAGHVTAVGGVCKPRADLALCTWRTYESAADGQPATNRYGEPSPPKLCGVGELGRKLYVEVGPQPLYRLSWNEEPVMLARELTRVHTWEVVINAPASAPAPWTRVNNCNQPGELAGDSAGLAGPDLPDFYRPGARPPRLHPPPGG